MTILLVEDDEGLRVSLQHELLRAGHSVLVAATADEGLWVYASRCDVIRLVITDYQLPGMNGRALVQRLRAADPTLPVILMSAHDRSVAAPPASNACFLRKPFRASTLLATVGELMAGGR